jgi:hypothetical protein
MDEAILLRRVRLEEVRIVEERTPPPSTPTDERSPIRRVQGAQGFLKKNDIERLSSDLAFFAHAWASSPRRPADATCGGQVWGRAWVHLMSRQTARAGRSNWALRGYPLRRDGAPVRTKLRTRISLKLLYNLTSPQLCEPTRHFFCNLISTSLEAVRQGHDGRYAGRDRSRVVEQRMQPELPIAVSITFSSRRYRTA